MRGRTRARKASSDLEPLDTVLRRHGLTGVPEEPFPNDGWSGASLTRLRRGGGDRFILKRDSLARDWIAQATNDGPLLREAWFAARARHVGDNTSNAIRASYLDVGLDGDEVGLLMPDLSGVLFDWTTPIRVETLDWMLSGLAALHAYPWEYDSVVRADPSGADPGPHSAFCPLRERITLICRSSLERPGPQRDAIADRLLPGWDAFDRLATPAARDLIALLGDDPQPLLDALAAQPKTLIHGDLKLANVGIGADGVVDTIDWQMVSIAPIAIELGWFLVANVASLPVAPETVLEQYATKLLYAGSNLVNDGWSIDRATFDESGVDAAILVGLLLRGWRKGADTEAGVVHASGVSAADDLAWWCDRAVAAADRIL